MAEFLKGEKLKKLLDKYKYAAIVVAVGVLLMLIPWNGVQKESAAVTASESITAPNPEQELETLLSSVKGAGRVEVMLTLAAGERKIYQTDSEQTENHVRTTTVILSDGQRAEAPVVSQILPPEYLGAVVVCDGASDPKVKLAIVEAVSKATGLGADRITVLKMK